MFILNSLYYVSFVFCRHTVSHVVSCSISPYKHLVSVISHLVITECSGLSQTLNFYLILVLRQTLLPVQFLVLMDKLERLLLLYTLQCMQYLHQLTLDGEKSHVLSNLNFLF